MEQSPINNMFQSLASDAFAAAAARRRAPYEPRPESPLSPTETAIGKIGVGLGKGVQNAIEFPGKYMRDPQNAGDPYDWGASTALGMVGAPGVPGGSLGSSASKGFRAWHGSPSEFERFDKGKRLSGEGSNAFGDGIYVAENKNTGQFYADRDPTKPHHLYEVQVNADKQHFLDWDRPVNAQPESVQKVTRDLGVDLPEGAMGGDLYKTLENRYIEKKFADVIERIKRGEPAEIPPSDQVNAAVREFPGYMHSNGVPGTTFFENGQRGAVDASRNYVLFDDSIVDILRKYGLAGLSTGGLGTYLSAQSPVDQNVVK